MTLLKYREVKLVERLEQIESNLFRQMIDLAYLRSKVRSWEERGVPMPPLRDREEKHA